MINDKFNTEKVGNKTETGVGNKVEIRQPLLDSYIPAAYNTHIHTHYIGRYNYEKN